MPLPSSTLIRFVLEPRYSPELLGWLKASGVRQYWYYDTAGSEQNGQNLVDGRMFGHLIIEVSVCPTTAEALLERVRESHLPPSAMTGYVLEAAVLEHASSA